MPVDHDPGVLDYQPSVDTSAGDASASRPFSTGDAIIEPSPSSRPLRGRGAFLLGLTVASVVFALVVWVYGGQGIYHDAYNYYLLAKLIGGAGVFGYAVSPEASTGYFPLLLKAKPNGYPLIAAVSGVLSTFDMESLRGVMFFVQLGALTGISWFGARRLGSIFRSNTLEVAFYAATVLNPLLLFFVVELMSDLLSAMFAYLAVVLALPLPGACRRDHVARDLVWSFFVASLATTVRSGNVVIVAALLLIWAARWLWFRDVNWRVVPLAAVAAVIPFLPQFVANYLAFGIVTPLLAESGYAGDLDFGARILKYVTAVIPDQPVQWVYTNPLLPPDVLTAADFWRVQPLGYIGTLGLHLFALLDQDVPFVFVTDFQPWYRWPLAVLNYLFVATAMAGFTVGIRRGLVLRTHDPRFFALAATLLAGLACVVLYVPPHVENRYSLPLYPLWVAGSVYGLAMAWSVIRSRRWRSVSVMIASGFAFLAGCIAMSAWLETLRHPLY
jgi:hypothetical protein